MITRKEYVAGDFTLSEYMRDIIKDAGCSAHFGDEFKALLRKEWDAGNVHFNRGSRGPSAFTLDAWDMRAAQIGPCRLNWAMKERGTWLSPSDLVCIIKELARMAIGE